MQLKLFSVATASALLLPPSIQIVESIPSALKEAILSSVERIEPAKAECSDNERNALLARMDEHSIAINHRARVQTSIGNLFSFFGGLTTTGVGVTSRSYPTRGLSFQGRLYEIPTPSVGETQKLVKQLRLAHPACF